MPPKAQVNKDFLKAVFTDEKKLLLKKAITTVHVPRYDELSVKQLWPALAKDPGFRQYFPDNFAEHKGPSRSYFFDILNTLYPEYLTQISDHANKQRMTATGDGMADDRIHISEAWQERLNAMPYLSRKCRPPNLHLTSLFFLQASPARPSTYLRPSRSRSSAVGSARRCRSSARSRSTRRRKCRSRARISPSTCSPA